MKYVVNRLQRLFSNIYFLLAFVVLVATAGSFIGVRVLRLGKNTKTVKAANCQGICVAIKEIGMEPNSITVKVGEYVQFNTADGKKHNISLGKGAGDATSQNAPHEHQGDYSSGEFGAGEAWRVQFKKAGTFRLHDDNNPKDNILVVVYEPGADLKIH